jgi:hypothetical protein
MRVTATPRPTSLHAPLPDVSDAGRRDGPQLLVLHLRVPEVVEEASTVTEHQRNDVQLKFVQQSRCQVPLPDLSISHDIPVPAAKQNSAARPGSVLKFATSAACDDPVGSAICVGKREGSSIVWF